MCFGSVSQVKAVSVWSGLLGLHGFRYGGSGRSGLIGLGWRVKAVKVWKVEAGTAWCGKAVELWKVAIRTAWCGKFKRSSYGLLCWDVGVARRFW